jgi:hypothetical protein
MYNTIQADYSLEFWNILTEHNYICQFFTLLQAHTVNAVCGIGREVCMM